MKIPSHHQAVMPYLMLKNAAAFIDFAATVFKADLIHKGLRDDNKTIMHAEIQIGGSTIMFTEVTEQWSEKTAHMFVYVPDADEAYETALKNGAITVMELSNQDYGRTCGVSDPFGNTWWITSVK